MWDFLCQKTVEAITGGLAALQNFVKLFISVYEAVCHWLMNR